MLHTTKIKFVSLGVVALATAGLLTGCAGGTGSGSAPASSSSSSSSTSSVALPASFPKTVPLVKGSIAVAAGDANDGWSVTVEPSGKKGFADATAALAQGGFTKQAGSSSTQATFQNAGYTVSVSTPGESVTYIVSTR